MKTKLELGPVPGEEPCAQVGTDFYEERAREECKRFIALLKEKFPNTPEGVMFRIKGNDHDFGTYYDVVIAFDDEIEEHVAYAYDVEARMPLTWSGELRDPKGEQDATN